MTKSLLLLPFLLPVALVFGAGKFDVQPPQKRLPSVELAQRLSTPPVLEALPADLKPPFNPPGFDQPDEAEAKARAAAAAAAAAEQKTEPAKAAGDREILGSIADYLNPTGTIVHGNQSILMARQKKYKVGDKITLSYEGRNVEVEITEITRTSFSLRLNRTEISRPIKSFGKSS